MKITGIAKNKKFVALISIVALFGMLASAPAQAGESKSRRIIELANPSGVVVTPAATSLAVAFNTVPNATSYTVRVYQGTSERLVGSARTLFNSGNSVTGLTPLTDYKVSVQAIGNGTTYSNSEEPRKVRTRTRAEDNVTWNSNCPNSQVCEPAIGGSSSYRPGQSITAASDPSQPGWDFTGWLSNNPNVTSTSFPTTPRSTYGDVTFTARWELKTYNVFWNSACPELQPCTEASNGSSTYKAGQSITAASDPNQSGWDFKGWSSNNTNIDASFPSTPRSRYGNVTFIAQWEPKTNNPIIWNSNCHSACSKEATGGSSTYTTGRSIANVAAGPEETGWKFIGWSPDPSVTPTFPYGLITFTAQWEADVAPITHTITWDPRCQSDFSVANNSCELTYGTYTEGQAIGVNPPNVFVSNYQFQYWYLEGGDSTHIDSSYIPPAGSGDITFVPYGWEAISQNNSSDGDCMSFC